jgi:hypothetical protein
MGPIGADAIIPMSIPLKMKSTILYIGNGISDAKLIKI